MSDYFDESLHADVDRYLLGLLPPRDVVLSKMERFALERGFPFIGPLAGEVLFILARSIGARRVYEMGSGFGYSALHLARAIPEGGTVICTDGDAQNKERAEEYFREAGLLHKLDFRVGDALDMLDAVSGEFDIVLIDIGKEDYPAAFRKAWPRLRIGGLFMADNLLWHGRVLTDDDSPSTRGVREFTRLLFDTPGARSTIIPLRDGVSVTLKTE